MKVNQELIFDVGLHTGEDTGYYLKKGYHVVAFEANPDLVKQAKINFKAEIECGKLVIIEGAIVPENVYNNKTKVMFYRDADNPVWGTVSEEWNTRNKNLGSTSETIEVSTVNFKACLQRFGIPYYLKIDIEGMDTVCLEALKDFEVKPFYISVESEKVDLNALEQEIDLMLSLGYKDFKAVNQMEVPKQKQNINSEQIGRIEHNFEFGSSGLFGSDLPGTWLDREGILKKYRWIFKGYKLFGDDPFIRNKYLKHYGSMILSGVAGTIVPGWYDTHARHSSVKNTGL